MTNQTEIKKKVAVETELEELGFVTVAKKVKDTREFERKAAIAYEHFRYVKPEKFEEFNNKLFKKTWKKTGPYGAGTYDTLKFTRIEDYPSAPPAEVLEKLKEAKQFDCFDRYQIATIESVEVRPDPILFGLVKGCPDKFFIGQWDNDVKIEDILESHEG